MNPLLYNQSGILLPSPLVGRYIELNFIQKISASSLKTLLEELIIDERLVLGLGYRVAELLGYDFLTRFSAIITPEITIPETQTDIWLWLREEDRGEIVVHFHELMKKFSPFCEIIYLIDSFRYGYQKDKNYDLTGYEDGIENPKEEKAFDTAFSKGSEKIPDGSSFVVVQKWIHDLDHFWDLSSQEQDYSIGRSRLTEEELDQAPVCAHVKRTAQESFTPESFLLRRSAPFTQGLEEGLVFVAFSSSFASYERILNRMVGKEDGIIDKLFSFSKPVTGSYFWCPPVYNNKIMI